MALLTSLDGKKIMVGNEEDYLAYLNSTIEGYRKLLSTRQLSQEEEKELKECMNLYNQLFDYINEREADLAEAVALAKSQRKM